MVLTHNSDSPAQFLPSSGSHIQQHNLDLNQKSFNKRTLSGEIQNQNYRTEAQACHYPLFVGWYIVPEILAINDIIVILRLIHIHSAVLSLLFCLLFCIYCDTKDISPPVLPCVINISVTDQDLTFRGPSLQPVQPGMGVLLVQSIPPVNLLGIREA